MSTGPGTGRKPWWKRTWVLVLAGLFVIGLIGSAVSPPQNDSGDGSSSGASSSAEDDDASEQIASVGESLTVEGTRYRVLSAEKEFSVGESFARERADGIFVIVRIELTNLKDDTRTITSEAIKLIGDNDNAYDTTTDALLAVDDAFLLEDVQPDLPKQGTLVYDVPLSATQGARLRVEDLFSDEHGFIELGL